MTVKLLMLTQFFDPEPMPRGLEFARALVARGFDVEVVTGFPNYPGGKIYSGYRQKLLHKEIVDGIKITRVPLYPSHDGSARGRVANYLSFAFSALLYCVFLARKPDVIYVYHPPLTIGITAGITRAVRGVPVVYDIQDMWPESLRASGMVGNERFLSFAEKVCQWVYRHVDKITVISPGFKRCLLERGVPDSKVEVIYNWCDESAVLGNESDSRGSSKGEGYFDVLFAGNMGKGQGLDSVLDAAEILLARGSRVRFKFLGGGVEVDRLKKSASDRSLSNVIFVPRVPMSEVGPIMNEADALLVHLKDNPLYRITIPSKTQAYMAVGKPILMAVPGDAADLVEAAKCGTSAISEDANSIANAADFLSKQPPDALAQMGDNARSYYGRTLSMRVGADRFAQVFRQLVH